MEVHELGFAFAILDCHGGLDYISLAAYEIADRSLVVTEADIRPVLRGCSITPSRHLPLIRLPDRYLEHFPLRAYNPLDHLTG
jgi:hypothetical protein